MAWLAHPLRVQRVSNWRFKRRRLARGVVQRPCWRCGYEMRGLPEARCPECGEVHDPAWDEGWLRAGGWARVLLLMLPIGLGWGAFLGSLGVVLVCAFAYDTSLQIGSERWMLASAGASAVVGGVLGLVVSAVTWRWSHRLVWGVVRPIRIWSELGAIALLCVWLGWEVVTLAVMV